MKTGYVKYWRSCIFFLTCIAIALLTIAETISITCHSDLKQGSYVVKPAQEKETSVEICIVDPQSVIPIEKIENASVCGPVSLNLKDFLSINICESVSSIKKNYAITAHRKNYSSTRINLSPVICQLQI